MTDRKPNLEVVGVPSRGHVPLLAAMLALAACGAEAPPAADTPTFAIDTNRITVSGVSSGAMMATQMHVAMSELVHGTAMIAGGPYYCAEGSLKKGLGPCVNGGDVGVSALVDYAKSSSESGSINDVANLIDDPVWLFSGKNDAVVHHDLIVAANAFYSELAGITPIVVDDVAAPHGFPTLYSGATCSAMAEPFLNACNYDAAGEMLRALYPDLQPRGETVAELLEIPQPLASDATMLPNALAYVPVACRDGEACGIHVAFHGCRQSSEFVGDVFARKAGYNEWAETNRLIILYPQVDSSKIAPMNPMGCWDWWGYTGDNYATRSGEQITVVKATLDALAGETL